MCKIPVIRIEQVVSLTEKQIGIQYLDDIIDLTSVAPSEKLSVFIDEVRSRITPETSVILYRQDVKRLADTISNGAIKSGMAFREIKSTLRSLYTVLKLKYNPRTQEFCGAKTAFILHHNSIDD
jgi:hypothetical protein